MSDIKYYAEANGSLGRVSFWDNALCGITNILKYTGDLTEISKNLKASEIEVILHPGFEDRIDGIILRGKSFAIIRENTKNEFTQLEENELKKMTEHLKNAKIIHDEWEKIYVSRMNFAEADRWAEEISGSILSGLSGRGEGNNFDRFFGTMTPSSSVNYVDCITESFNRRIFIKGRPGTGKSTFLRKIRENARALGFNTETYYCSFDPKSLDMVVIRSLGVCVFDSTSPHEMFPSRGGDEIFDMYEQAVEKNTDEAFAPELKDISRRYSREMRLARKSLADACTLRIKADSSEQNNISSEQIMQEIREFIS